MRSHAKAASVGSTLRLLGAAALAICALFLLGAAPAHAIYAQTGQVGGTGPGEDGSGSEDGQLANHHQADVNDASGALYVADTGNDRVQRFTPTATAAEFSAKAAIAAPTGLAIDQSDGSVYVSNATGISKFDADLNPVIIGWSDPGVTGTLAVDPSSGDLLVADQGASLVRRYDSDGTADGSFAAARPLDVAATAAGEVLVVTSTDDVMACAGTSSVVRFSPSGAEEGTIGSLEAPGQVDVDPDDGSIAVAAPVNGYNCGSTTPSLHFFDSSGNPLDSFELPNAQYGYVPGLAAQGGGSDRVFASLRSPLNDLWVTARVSVVDQVFPPEATLDPITNVTGTEAELTGTVDANGQETSYRFEISKDNGDTWNGLGSESAGAGEDPVAVTDTATNLDPNTAYLIRLIATNSGGEVTAGPEGFQTPPLGAAVVSQNASTTRSEATLQATIETGNTETTYRFEYGPTAAYGKSTAEKTVAASLGTKVVSATIGGLTPGATYHFRVLVENSEGADEGDDRAFTTETPPSADTCPNAAIRAAQGSQYLPECRAYEMVSPVEKNGVDIASGAATRASASGSSVSFMSSGNLESVGTGPRGYSTYLYDRTPTGWDGEGINVYQDSNVSSTFVSNSNVYVAFSEELTHGALLAREPFPDPAATPGIPNIFAWDRVANSFRGATPNESGTTPPFTQGTPSFSGATPEFDQIVFNTDLNLTPDASGSNLKAYHWHDGSLELVGIPPGPGATPFDSSVIGSGTATQPGYPGTGEGHAISADGSKVFFTDFTGGGVACTGDCKGPVYLRKNGEETILLNEDENPAEDVPLGQAQFMLATPDGSAAFFTSRQRLLEADQDAEDARGIDLYRYDTTVPPGEANLTLISDPSGMPPISDASGEGVLGVLGVSDDGSRAYFARRTTNLDGELWAYDAGQLEKVAELWAAAIVPADSGSFPLGGLSTVSDADNWHPQQRAAATIADGRRLLFRSSRQQADAFDNAGTAQLYLYDAVDGSTTCVSCNRGSDRATGSASVRVPGGFAPSSPNAPRALSADGGTVLFNSREALVSRDTNGLFDAYSFDVASGRVSLLSSGTGPDHSQFQSASADGKAAFVLTRDRLVASDRDGLRDLYAVRVNGGFPEPAPPPAPCEGDGCQGAGAPPPSAGAFGSAAFRGAGNASRGRGCSVPRKKAAKAKQRVRRAESKAQKAKAKKALRKARARACRKGAGS